MNTTGSNIGEICPLCGGSLETSEHYPFRAGIFFHCKKCNEKFKKVNITDMTTGKYTSWMILIEKNQTGGIA